ncbi:unnamed protein product [Haemonchus placei]|uniref:Peptidylprolyl isomerase n=1 Tax=Haemonchus placei TaxID=6290 RepID=A0A0N4WSL4_HAEPC|nr:unnamed protein product [Haemonchus placei]
MEDLTPSEAELNPAFASGSFETDRIIGGVDKTMMRMGPEWVVPLQYSNSPIVQELAESGEEVGHVEDSLVFVVAYKVSFD